MMRTVREMTLMMIRISISDTILNRIVFFYGILMLISFSGVRIYTVND